MRASLRSMRAYTLRANAALLDHSPNSGLQLIFESGMRIAVDERFQTSIPHIHAAGDVERVYET